jgi:hypothetical protein
MPFLEKRASDLKDINSVILQYIVSKTSQPKQVDSKKAKYSLFEQENYIFEQ